MAVSITRWIGSLAGLGALALGLLFWIANIDFISIHMLLGITLALSLLLLGLVALVTRGMRPLGSVGVIYALVMPVFGLTQDRILEYRRPLADSGGASAGRHRCPCLDRHHCHMLPASQAGGKSESGGRRNGCA